MSSIKAEIDPNYVVLDGDYFGVINDQGMIIKVIRASQIVAAVCHYGELRNVAGAPTSQTPGTTPVLYTGFDEDGLASGIAVDNATDLMTPSVDGIYQVEFGISFGGTISAQFDFEFMKDIGGTPTQTGIRMSRKLGTGGDVGSASMQGLAQLTADQTVGVYVSSVVAAQDIDTYEASLILKRVA